MAHQITEYGKLLDIPETQLIAVIILGFLFGWLLVPRLIGHTIIFSLISGASFFLVRWAVAVLNPENTHPAAIIGNGILSALVMYTVFIGSMLIGDFIIRRQWDKVV